MADNQATINQDIKTDNQISTSPQSSILVDSTNKKPSKNVHLKFASPLKILDIDSRREYIKSVLCAIGIGIAQISIGAVLMTILDYSLKTGDTHAILCSLAYHFFSAQAILTFNHSNGWSKTMRIRHKRFTHIFLQLCALGFATFGTILFVPSDRIIPMFCHGITGFLTTALTLITLVIGPLAFYGTYRQKLIHVAFGLMTFMMSSISLCSGILTPSFKNYLNSSTILYIIISFIIFYTLLIIIMCIIKNVT